MSVSNKSMFSHPTGVKIKAQPDTFIVRAPGRVNLIGEHTDYNGLPVLPMAIDREIKILASPADDSTVRLVNADPSFERRKFDALADVKPFEQGDWGNYAKAAVVAVANWAGVKELKGFDALVAGDIPPGSGLSSSSAMVVACALAAVHVNRLDIPKNELCELLAKGERYVGTEGGGMDQTVSLMGEQGKALKIDFFPIRVTPAVLPAGHSVVVCNTLVSAKKSGESRNAYNTRVVECRIGLSFLREMLRKDLPVNFKPGLLGDLMKPEFQISHEKLLEAVETLPDKMENVDNQELLRLRDGSLLPVPDGGFKIRSRSRHVFSEAMRVEKALSSTDAASFGALMDASHESCSRDYEVSCRELDALVSISRESGALGARLTGAGFGGCAIALVADDKVPAFIVAVSAKYYNDYLPEMRPDISLPDDLGQAIFACKPAAGAEVIESV